MELKQTKLARADNRRGSALIMVVVLTVLLAVIGVLFVMAARIDEMATSSVVYDHELDHAVDSVVELISQRLTDDLDLPPAAPAFDYPGSSDNWLGVIDPVSQGDNGTPGDYTDDDYIWRHISILAGPGGGGLLAEIYQPADANDFFPADADGDGVTDSLWVRLPDVTTSRGKPVFAAVRIIDNCSMLNLNTASYIADPNVWPDWEGRYLSSVDYSRFLRGADRFIRPEAIPYARQGGSRPLPMPPLDPPDVYHRNAIMHIENPGPNYSLFDISDELEMRNRFLLTSLFEARFERFDVANFTLDAGGGVYGALQIPRKLGLDSDGIESFSKWKWRLDPINFDNTSGAYVDNPANPVVDYRYKYDRRHVCTFYSFDRNLRTGYYPILEPLLKTLPQAEADFVKEVLGPAPVAVNTNYRSLNYPTYNNVETRKQILKLLYAFRAYYLEKYPSEDFKQAARRAAQIVANMIDYVDDIDPLTEGPFFPDGTQPDAYVPPNFWDYGGQTNDDLTYINRNVIRELIIEVSNHLSNGQNMIDIGDTSNINSTPYEFGLGLDVNDPDETIYGYERQPFISEIVRYQSAGNPDYYAIELCNPYDLDISLDNWKIKIGASEYPFAPSDSVIVPAMSAARVPGRLLLYSHFDIVSGAPQPQFEVSGLTIPSNEIVELQRPDPTDLTGTEFITVDKTEVAQADEINTGTDWRASKRDDTEWKFTNAGSYTTNDVRTLGQANAVSLNPDGYQMPVADNNVPVGTLHDFEMVLAVGNDKSNDPNLTAQTVTEYVAAASDEGDIRTDVASGPPYPLDYVCFVGRPEGTLPGRINVNTATKEVIRAAIPPDAGVFPDDYEALATSIEQYRNGGPLQRITNLLNVSGFDQFETDPNDNVGDPEMRDDFEERDWILSRVANKFTVRSDVFTAYILVRLGYDGPERRMIAIFDRSNVSKPIGNNKPEKPRIIALHPVPDPR